MKELSYGEQKSLVDTHGLTPVALYLNELANLALAFTHGLTPVVLC